ncbi:MAG: N-acetylglucosamine-6-phosphate deacetylase [Clostridia bacterium]|nr:N-acetylglucosamine-6-phosphate deacetylase [Clostridia bacterium]
MADFVLKNVKLGGRITDLTASRENGRILSVGRTDAAGRDLRGAEIVAGYIDIHSHGCMGYNVTEGKGFPEMSAFLAANGTTSWCPTTETVPVSELRALLRKSPDTGKGAHALGFHLEGPYISLAYRGAMNPDYARLPDTADFKGLEHIVMMTLAPELEGALDFIRSAPFHCSVGHTNATYEEARAAFAAGADCVTHLFNAMSPMHHREPAVAGAALTEGAYVQVISDGIHLHPATVLAAYRMYGSDRMILISDAMSATGLGDGAYTLGGMDVTVTDGVARTASGALAGSTVTLGECVRRAVSFGIPRDEALKMASETPAKYLGLPKGKLAPGYDADILIVDEALNVKETILCHAL